MATHKHRSAYLTSRRYILSFRFCFSTIFEILGTYQFYQSSTTLVAGSVERTQSFPSSALPSLVTEITLNFSSISELKTELYSATYKPMRRAITSMQTESKYRFRVSENSSALSSCKRSSPHPFQFQLVSYVITSLPLVSSVP